MSFLTSRVARLSPQTQHLRLAPPSIRSFASSPRFAALSESDHNDDARKQAIDEHKDDQLSKQKEGKGHWKGELSSNSEGAIKADRGEIHDAHDDIAELQKQTSAQHEKDHEHGNKS